MDLTHAFLPITKVDKNDDGTANVYGKASGPDLDADQQICDGAWLSKAMPTWFETGANVREMHQPIAAGVGETLEQQGEDWWLKSTIIDPGSVKKIDAKALTGYSIGIKAPKIVKDASAPGGRIVGGQIVEVSLVDRPANVTCKLALAKSVGAGEQVTVPEGAQLTDVFDVEHNLVKVEELEQPPAAGLTKLNDALTKAIAEDETLEVDELPLIQTAVDAIAQLIQAEADELPEDSGEAWDIQMLVDALRALREFWFSEAQSGEVPDPVTVAQTNELAEEGLEGEDVITLTQLADLTKAATTDDAPAEAKDSVEVLVKSLAPAIGAELEQLPSMEKFVTAIVAKATKALDERVAKALTMAAPGPVRTRSNADVAQEAQTALKVNIDEWRSMADKATDPDVRKGYLTRASEAERALASQAKE